MLSNLAEAFAREIPPTAVPAYDGFPFWNAFLTEPNREKQAANWLKRANVLVYLPMYMKRQRRRGTRCFHKAVAAISGMLFVPEVMIDFHRRDEVFELAGVKLLKPYGVPLRIRKSDIELVRIMEARLNLPQEAKGVLFKLGQEVTFADALFAANWLGGKIFEIADEHRIGVEVPGLFGQTTRVYVSESEIEAK